MAPLNSGLVCRGRDLDCRNLTAPRPCGKKNLPPQANNRSGHTFCSCGLTESSDFRRADKFFVFSLPAQSKREDHQTSGVRRPSWHSSTVDRLTKTLRWLCSRHRSRSGPEHLRRQDFGSWLIRPHLVSHQSPISIRSNTEA